MQYTASTPLAVLPARISAWAHSREYYEQAEAEGRIRKLCTHTSNLCTKCCPGCFVVPWMEGGLGTKAKRRLPGEMSLETQKALLQEAAANGCEGVDWIGAGEPTIDPHLDALVREAHSLGMQSTIFTVGDTPFFRDAERLLDYKRMGACFIIKKWATDAVREALYLGRSGDTGYSSRRDATVDKLVGLGFTEGQDVLLDGYRFKTTQLGYDILIRRSNINDILSIHRESRARNIMTEMKTFIPQGATMQDHHAKMFDGLPPEQRSMLLAEEVTEDDPAMITLLENIRSYDASIGIPAMPDFFYPQSSICTQSAASVYIDIGGQIWDCVGCHDRYNVYEPDGDMLANVVRNRKNRVGTGCWPRYRKLTAAGKPISPLVQLQLNGVIHK